MDALFVINFITIILLLYCIVYSLKVFIKTDIVMWLEHKNKYPFRITLALLFNLLVIFGSIISYYINDIFTRLIILIVIMVCNIISFKLSSYIFDYKRVN